MNYELKRYAFGETIGKGFNMYFDNLIPIVIVSILCKLPNALFIELNHAKVPPEYQNLSPEFFLHFFIPMMLQFFVACFATLIAHGILSAFIICRVSNKLLEHDIYRQRPVNLFLVMMKVIVITLLVGIITCFATLACVIPGIIVGLGFSMTTQILVIENRRIFESMWRSWDLVKNKMGEVFLFSVVTFIMMLCINESINWMFSLIFKDRMQEYLTLLASAIVSPVVPCIFVIIYFNLRIQKEGFNIEHLVQQFSLPDAITTEA